MRKLLIGTLFAVVTAGCGQVHTAVDPAPTSRAGPKPGKAGLEVIGEYQARVTPNADGRTALFEVNIVKDGQPGTNPAQSIELYSSDYLRIGSGHGSSCLGDDLYAPVVIKSYYSPDQLRDVVAEMTTNSGTGNGLCSRGSAPEGYTGNSELYNYANIDPWNGTAGTASSDSVTWAFNYANLTPFYINFRVWARKWPEAGTGTILVDGGYAEDPFLSVQTDTEVTSLLSRLYSDAAFNSPIQGSDYINTIDDGQGGWEVYPNDGDGIGYSLTEGQTYYVKVFSQGPNSTGAYTITGSGFLTDSFKYAVTLRGVSPTGGQTVLGANNIVYGGSDERLHWTTSALSTSSRYTVYKCFPQGDCSGRGPVIATMSNVLVGMPITQSNQLTALVNNTWYRWTATQYFSAVPGGVLPDQIFKYYSGSRP
jgi:hypothetical protein